MLKGNILDPGPQRRGQILSVVILVVGATTAVLAAINIFQGQYQYNVENGIFLGLILGLYVLNRVGYVYFASIVITALLVVASMFLLSERQLAQTFIVVCVPVFIASFLIVPWSGIVVAAVVILGTLILGYSTINYLSLFVLAAVTVVVYLLTRNLNIAHQENRYKAFHDSLTGLPNRDLFLDRLQQALDRSIRDKLLRAVLFVDLDNFKVINDSLGHKAGDELLTVAAERLRACLRPADTAARLGGDEFVVLIDDVTGVGDADRRSVGRTHRPWRATGRRPYERRNRAE